ncbi:MAG TPA: SCO5389 family protein [Micromonospora sp.]|nr:MAG: hypothetical protein DIU79_15140 [Actinomycetota bacterium]
MSLKVAPALLERAKAGTVTDEEFLTCIRESLPYAWEVISRTAERLKREGGEFAEDNTPPPSPVEQGQLLRLLASSSMRSAVERHFGVRVEFQNCCKVALFRPEAVDGAAHKEFVSPRAQLLNQAPHLVNC